MTQSFTVFFQRFKLKGQATSNITLKEMLNQMTLNTKIYMRDINFSKNSIIDVRQCRGPDWISYMNENYFDSYGCLPLKLLSNFISKKHRKRKFVFYFF